ncbi:hypothetical protein Tco_1016423 [Tanacetum coccineum]|uniref:Gag protein n=1 Tax=Tanacetum coccineum TaxID=301880 RepID=A0ABQ5FPU2_9ASTR
MTTLAEHIIVAGAENHPPILEKSMYDSWASRIRLFIKGNKNGRMMLDSIDEGPLVYPTVVGEYGQTRPRKYSELTEAQQLQDDCDVQATNIILHGLPPDVYALVNHQEEAKDIWDRVKLLMKGTELSYQERECRLYNLFDKFTSIQGETLYEYYWRFSQLINDMHTIRMTMQQVQVNKINPQQQIVSPQPFISLSMTQQSQAEIPQLDSSLVVPTFQQGEDLIDYINKEMAFLSAMSSRFPPLNNQLKTSSNPINHVTIQDGRVIVQQVQGRQTQSFAGTRNRGIATTSKGNYTVVQAKILDEEQLAFIADPGIAEVQVAQQTIPQISAFQTKDLDAYDLDYDVISSAKAIMMENLLSCNSDVLSEVPYSDTYLDDMINQDVQEMLYSEQTYIVDFPD